MLHPTIAAGLTSRFLDFAVSQGVARALLLAASGLDEAAIEDQDARVPLASFQTLIDTAMLEAGDTSLPARFPFDARIGASSVVGLIVHSSKSVGDSLIQLNRYARLMVEYDVMHAGGERFSVTPQPDGTTWITDNRPDPNSFAEMTEMAFGNFFSEFRHEFPERPFAEEIEVTHAPPPHEEKLRALWQAPLTFNATRNAFRIGPGWLETEFDGTSEYVFGLFTERADALLAELNRAETLRARIEAELLPVLHQGDVSADNVAKKLGMSRQTLYRHLKQEGATFASVVDALRHRMAADYLSARKVSVNQTAYLVGFSEASSFSRAFRRWTGQTPGEFRAAAV